MCKGLEDVKGVNLGLLKGLKLMSIAPILLYSFNPFNPLILKSPLISFKKAEEVNSPALIQKTLI